MLARSELLRSYFFTLASTLAAFLILIGGFQAHFALTEAEARTIVSRTALASAVSAELQRTVSEVERVLRAIADVPWTTDRLGLADRITEFERALAILPVVAELSLVDVARGELLHVDRVTAPRKGSAVSSDTALVEQAIRSRHAYSDVRFEPQKMTPYILFAVRDTDAGRHVTIARLNLQFMSVALGSAPGYGGMAFIIDQDGRLVAHSDRMARGRAIAFTPTPLAQAALAEARSTHATSGTWEERGDGDARMFHSWQMLRDGQWMLVLTQPNSVVFADFHRLLWLIMAVFAIGLLVAVAVSYWLAHRLSFPIVRLTRAAGELAAGRFDNRVPVPGRGEIADLTRSFNRMAGELGGLYRGLEETIAKRTAELDEQYQQREQQANHIAVLEERQRITRDIHDGVGGALVGLVVATRNNHTDRRQLAEMASDALADLRIAIDSLAPLDGDIATLLGTLKYRLSSRLEAAGISAQWDIGPIPEITDRRRETVFHIQRIVAEGITNAIKHSRAGVVHIRATWSEAQSAVIIEVADDGAGSSFAYTGGGFGHDNMRKRAEQIGGEVEMVAGPDGRGMTVRLTIPAVAVTPPAGLGVSKTNPGDAVAVDGSVTHAGTVRDVR